ncbi:MAG: hypothetical protein IPH07_02125 [Deltaproteobacteria bacterium]|nr:hypothetical protein [Deltaproteobacteria bacterium]MBK8238187.1 hypothetical protein [Deltaproteobacteria bacterium]MBK8718464.1 hypothetical protein [Deltaproteobacteria bacterium]MBP7290306.1 hypothetical protein [Nannocystaceae bacterium]
MTSPRLFRVVATQLLIAVTVLAAHDSEAAAAPSPSYPLRCRGGASMDMSLASNGFGFVLSFPFSHAAGGDPQTVAAGACTWLDRPLNPDEPTTLSFTHSTRARFSLPSVSGSDPTGGFSASTDSYADRDHIKQANALAKAIREGAIFTVEAYGRDGALVITRVDM